jgi:hypothetical protein
MKAKQLSKACLRTTLKVLGVSSLLMGLNLWLVGQGFGRLYEADFVQNTWLGGHLVLTGQNPYDPAAWQSAKDTLLPRPDIFPYYIYPIWVAILAVPFGLLPPLSALAVWTTLNVLLIYANLRLVYHLLQRKLSNVEGVILMTLVLFFIPTIHLLLEGQYNLLLLFLILLSLVGMQSRPSWINGLLLAFALSKPQSFWLPVGALLWWALVRRRWSELLGFLACSAALWIGPLLVYPNWWTEWLDITREQSIRLLEITPSFWGLARQLTPSVATPLALGLSLVTIFGAGLWWFRRVGESSTYPWEVAPLFMIGLLVSFYGLLYEQVGLVFPFWLCWQWTRRSLWRWVMVTWAWLLPLGEVALLALDPPYNQVFAIVQPLTLLPLYFYLRYKQAETQLDHDT